MIVPTIGRVVWLYHGGLGDVLQKVQPRAAIVAFVHTDRCVNLAAFGADGKSYGLTSVTLIQEGDDPPKEGGPGFCCWMPYQIGQQKKHEAAPAAA